MNSYNPNINSLPNNQYLGRTPFPNEPLNNPMLTPMQQAHHMVYSHMAPQLRPPGPPGLFPPGGPGGPGMMGP